MSIEHALIARARPYASASRINEIISLEASKGCLADLSAHPLLLEPAYSPVRELTAPADGCSFFQADKEHNDDFVRLQVWISPKHQLMWVRAERFIRILNEASHRIGFEISGNQDEIRICFLAHPDDLEILETTLAGEYPLSAMSDMSPGSNGRNPPYESIFFRDYFPRPPYSKRLTQHDQLHMSPYETLISALAALPSQMQGFSQVLFEPALNDWHRNVEVLTDLEFMGRLLGDPSSPQRYAQQAPSSDLRNMATEVEIKAHNDKPFYFAALRIGLLVTEQTPANIRPIAAFAKLFQHGGRPLRFLTEEDYLQKLSPEKISSMFRLGRIYRPGFLVNSSELAGLVHLPTVASFEENGLPLSVLETLPVHTDSSKTGMIIGKCEVAGSNQEVCVPPHVRKRSTHIIGRPGMGKSSVMEHMVLQDIAAGEGVAVIDPHGDLVEKLLDNIPSEDAEKTIYLDFGDPDWIPIWNPLSKTRGQSISRTTDELVAAIKSVVGIHNWGDRLEHLLRHGIYALLHLPDSTLQDLSNLLQHSRKNIQGERDRLKKVILDVVENDSAKKFWRKDYDSYRREDFAPPQHKLSKLLMGDETVSRMLCQPDSLLDFRDILDSQKVLLVNLSNVGPEARGILGCFMLSLFHLASLSRSRISPQNRKQFHIYCDEAHKFTSSSLEDTLAETRKYGVSLILAHQYLRQFKEAQRDALSSVGTTIIFNVDSSDAHFLVKNLRGKVQPRDLFELEVGEAIARIDTEIVRLKTPEPLVIPENNCRELIIRQSRERYYRHVSILNNRKKGQAWICSSKFKNSGISGYGANMDSIKEFEYDEFD